MKYVKAGFLPLRNGLTALAFLLLFASISAQNPEEVAFSHLLERISVYELTPQDVSDMKVTDLYTSRHNGVTHVYFQQAWNGIGIHRTHVNVNINDRGRVLNMGVSCQPDIARRVNASEPTISAMDAIQTVADLHHLGPVNEVSLLERPIGDDQRAEWSGGSISKQSITTRLQYIELEDHLLHLCWDLTIFTLDGRHIWNTQVDALNGRTLKETDMLLTCNFGPYPGEEDLEHCIGHGLDHASSSEDEEDKPLELIASGIPSSSSTNVTAQFTVATNPAEAILTSPVPSVPPSPAASPLLPNAPAASPPPNSYVVFAEPVESPNHGNRTTVSSPWNLTASPYGWHDDNGMPGPEYTITRGNNTFAREDQDGNDGPGTPTDGGSSLDFNFPYNPNGPSNANTDAAVVNLFYWVNRIHDMLYMYGFDEISGNFQQNNYGNGGLGGDFLFADAQDGAGINNATYGGGNDGTNGYISMYLWNFFAQNTDLVVNSPSSIADTYFALPANFGGPNPTVPITGDLILVDDGSAFPNQGCNGISNGLIVNGNIALVDMGPNCSPTDAAFNVQVVGATACIFCYDQLGYPYPLNGNNPAINIPVFSIGRVDCDILKSELANGVNITLSDGTPPNPIDGTFDNAIIAHEYGHGLSTRLVGGPSTMTCLSSYEQMGEGWSDWLGLVMTIEPGDAGEDIRGIGTFAFQQPTNGSGVRPAPYSTDMSINPLTHNYLPAMFGPHAIGSLWCTMLWEMTWELIDNIGFDPDLDNGTGGNNIALQLVVDGLKLVSCDPGFVDARDAILLADSVNYNGAHTCLIWKAFAKRGLGYSASQGSPFNPNDGVSAFDLPPYCISLPVEWTSISATPGREHITVDWEVSMELENQGFEVQRRAEGKGDFQKIGFVESKGETDHAVAYDYIDRDVRPGLLYEYRLLQVDLNGGSSYSNTVAAMITPGDQLLVELAPNPAGDYTDLRLGGDLTGGAVVQVMNLVGQPVMERRLNEVEARAGVTLELGSIPAGQYLIQVTAGGARKVEKLVVR